MPLRDGDDARKATWIRIAIVNAAGKTTYGNAFVTSLAVNRDHVAEIVACARARWKIENESFNVLKNHGYHLEHNFGHGKQHLAQMFVTLNLLAFALHTACDALETLWQQARQRLGPRKYFFRDLHTMTGYVVFPSWPSLLNAMIRGEVPT